jgi:hypothetical protein
MIHKLVQLVTLYDINYKKKTSELLNKSNFGALGSDGLFFVTRNCFID